MTLKIGLPETMYTPAQVATVHPTTGEVMLGGAMMTEMATPEGMGTMAMASPAAMGAPQVYHLEVHIVDHATGQVVANAQVTIALQDVTTGGSAVEVPVAIMQDKPSHDMGCVFGQELCRMRFGTDGVSHGDGKAYRAEVVRLRRRE